MYMTVEEVAKMLGFKVSTVKRHARKGLLKGHRLGGFNSPLRFDPIEIRAAMTGLIRLQRDIAVTDGVIGSRTPSAQAQYDELNRRCVKLAEALGDSKALHLLLKEVGGVDRLVDLDPDLYGKFRAALLRLATRLRKDGPTARSAPPEAWELVTGPAGTK